VLSIGAKINDLERPKRSLAQKNRFVEPTRLEILETKCMYNSLFVAKRPSTYSQGNIGKFGGENRGGVGKSGIQEHKSGNVSESRTDRGKVTMESL